MKYRVNNRLTGSFELYYEAASKLVRYVVGVVMVLAWILLTVVAGSAASTTHCEYESKAPRAIVADLDKMLTGVVDPANKLAAALGVAPGAVLKVRTPKWTYWNSKGVFDVNSQAPLRCTTPFQIGSNTKMMTATVLMQLAEEGRLSLDDRVSVHLPRIAARFPYGDKMTLRQLATHTSGIFSYTDNTPGGIPGIMEVALKDATKLMIGYTPSQLAQFAVDHGKPTFKPGQQGKWAYSNTGYVLLGMIIEKEEGQPLATVFKTRLFEPAGMRHTRLWNDVPKAEFGLPKAYYKAPYKMETSQWNMSQGWAAGGVISTPRDMVRFMLALSEGSFFKRAETFDAMKNGGGQAKVPFMTYGIGIGQKVKGNWGHGGQTLGFESDIGIFPKEGIVVILWTNVAKSSAALGLALIEPILRKHKLVNAPE